MNLTPEQRSLASKIYNSIRIVVTPEEMEAKGIKNSEDLDKYMHEEKVRQTKEYLAKRGIQI